MISDQTIKSIQKLNPDTPWYKTNKKWIIDPNVKFKTIKGFWKIKIFVNFGLGKDFLDTIPKA